MQHCIDTNHRDLLMYIRLKVSLNVYNCNHDKMCPLSLPQYRSLGYILVSSLFPYSKSAKTFFDPCVLHLLISLFLSRHVYISASLIPPQLARSYHFFTPMCSASAIHALVAPPFIFSLTSVNYAHPGPCSNLRCPICVLHVHPVPFRLYSNDCVHRAHHRQPRETRALGIFPCFCLRQSAVI